MPAFGAPQSSSGSTLSFNISAYSSGKKFPLISAFQLKRPALRPRQVIIKSRLLLISSNVTAAEICPLNSKCQQLASKQSKFPLLFAPSYWPSVYVLSGRILYGFVYWKFVPESNGSMYVKAYSYPQTYPPTAFHPHVS